MKAVGLVESPDHVCCRYRFRAFMPELEQLGWSVSMRPVPSGVFRQFWLDSRSDVTLLQRKLLDTFQLRLLRHRSSRLVFDFDDAVFLRDSYAAKLPNTHRRTARFRRTIQAADAVIAGNSFLAEQADQFTDPSRVFVIPTCVNPAKYEPKYELPEFEREDDSIELVWIGSCSTSRALERAQALLDAIGRELPGSRIKVICNRFPVFRNLPVVPVVWSEATEAQQLAASDIGVSWLPDDSWTRGKCGLKILQYMAAGLPVVASRVGVHPEMVEHGRSGFLVETEADWIEAIRMLASDPDLRYEMGRRGRQIVEEWYSVSRWAPVIDQILADRPAPLSVESAAVNDFALTPAD
jgi:glycosyltransferase involved in cell wall biosynthesis